MVIKSLIRPLLTEGRYAPQGHEQTATPSPVAVLATPPEVVKRGFSNQRWPDVFGSWRAASGHGPRSCS